MSVALSTPWAPDLGLSTCEPSPTSDVSTGRARLGSPSAPPPASAVATSASDGGGFSADTRGGAEHVPGLLANVTELGSPLTTVAVLGTLA